LGWKKEGLKREGSKRIIKDFMKKAELRKLIKQLLLLNPKFYAKCAFK
jgi:hypothetical protein